MGRVFDALRRSSAAPNSGQAKQRQTKNSKHRSETDKRILLTARQIEEQLFSSSSILKTGDETETV
jgi:hypothetical protein